MTPGEIEKSRKIKELIQRYETESDSDARKAIHKQLNGICEISEFLLNTYWEGCSLDEFCDAMAVDKIYGADFTRGKAIPILKEMCSLSPEDFLRYDYLYEKYGTAIEYVYRKPGYLQDAIYGQGKSFEEVMEYLNSSEGGPTLL